MVRDALHADFYSNLALLWGQESNKTSSTLELRGHNVTFLKTLSKNSYNRAMHRLTGATAKMFWGENIDEVLVVLDPLLWDSDRFRQRAAAEILAGILRGRLATFIYLLAQSYDSKQVPSIGRNLPGINCGPGPQPGWTVSLRRSSRTL